MNYSLDVSKIEEIYFYDGKFYILYRTSTSNAQFYREKFATADKIPELAIPIQFSVETVKEYYCPYCGSRIEWDADEPFCPKCGSEGHVKSKEIKVFTIKMPEFEEYLKWLAEKLTGKRVSKIEYEFLPPPEKIPENLIIKYETKDWRPKYYEIKGYKVFENPVFRGYVYDWDKEIVRKYTGTWIVFEVYEIGSGFSTILLKLE